jgi:hypothetical protein
MFLYFEDGKNVFHVIIKLQRRNDISSESQASMPEFHNAESISDDQAAEHALSPSATPL